MLESIIGDLKVDHEYVKNLIETQGMSATARILGFDVSHYDNLLLSGRLLLTTIDQETPSTLLEYAETYKKYLSISCYQFIQENHVILQKAIDDNYQVNYDHDWFSANTLKMTYLTKINGKIIERPQYLYMRVAIQMYCKQGVSKVISTYQELAEHWYTPASPTLFNAGTKQHQLSSCFLVTIDDKLESILYRGVGDCGMISKANGGLGCDVSRVRHSEIGSLGISQGLVPMLQMFNSMIRYVDQGSRRKGSISIFLRPHHIDVFEFVSLVDTIGDRYLRAHDLNICLWMPNLFYKRLQEDGNWTLFCPAKTKKLNDIYGSEFEKQYVIYEQDETIPKKIVKASELYNHIISVQRKAGMPYMMNADACNFKSNHKHMGYIRSSNLCLEIVEYTDDKTISSCNLSSVSLRKFAKAPVPVDHNTPSFQDYFDFHKFGQITRKVVSNLNEVIDSNWYPLDKNWPDEEQTEGIIRKTNKRDRPIGCGVSGWAEMLHIMDLPVEDPKTKELNKQIFACMYYNSLVESVQLAIKDGEYDTFDGSPMSANLLQFDLWRQEFELLGENPARKAEDDVPVDPTLWGQQEVQLFDNDGDVADTIIPSWDDLKRVIVKYGTRNSLLLAMMPTASTSQLLRNCESLEMHTSNLYSRKVANASYPVINRFLIKDLEELGLWNDNTVEFLKASTGSIANFNDFVHDNLSSFPNFTYNYIRLEHVQKKYKTMWKFHRKLCYN